MISDILGLSGRRMIEALIAGESDPDALAVLAHRRIKAPPAALREALRGRVTNHHRFLLQLHGCTSSTSMLSTRPSTRSIGRSTAMSSPFARRSCS